MYDRRRENHRDAVPLEPLRDSIPPGRESVHLGRPPGSLYRGADFSYPGAGSKTKKRQDRCCACPEDFHLQLRGPQASEAAGVNR